MVTLLRLLMLLFAFETAGDDTDDAGDEASEDQKDDTDDEDEPILNAKLKAVHDEAAKWRRKYRDLEAGNGVLAVRHENSFMKAVLAHGGAIDMDTAWTLMESKGFLDAVTVNEDGTVDDETMSEALAKVLDRYPWLGDDPDDEPDPKPLPPRTGGARKKQDSAPTTNLKDLRQRFPALRGRGR